MFSIGAGAILDGVERRFSRQKRNTSRPVPKNPKGTPMPAPIASPRFELKPELTSVELLLVLASVLLVLDGVLLVLDSEGLLLLVADTNDAIADNDSRFASSASVPGLNANPVFGSCQLSLQQLKLNLKEPQQELADKAPASQG